MTHLIKQIHNEVDEYADDIGKIETGQVVIEIRHGKVGLTTWINKKTPKKQANLFDKTA
jgi:hypothetical protein